MPIFRVEISIDEPEYRWMREHGTLQIPDVREQNDFPMLGAVVNFRTFLVVPLRHQGNLIGGLFARRTEMRAFTPAQIKLLETFADQAVIAIENVRLFQELKEALEQQTATSEILGVIASSPTDVQPVLDTIAQSAARLCGSDDATIRLLDGNDVRRGAPRNDTTPIANFSAAYPRARLATRLCSSAGRSTFPTFRRKRRGFRTAHIWARGIRTFLVTPLLREGTAIGLITIRRTEVKPFTDKQVALLETFASQAVIAIENVRLFKELQERNHDLTEALEQQTATSEILSVISSSPTDLQPVFETILTNAARLCDANTGGLYRFDGEYLNWVAGFGLSPEWRASHSLNHRLRPGTESATRRAALERRISSRT